MYETLPSSDGNSSKVTWKERIDRCARQLEAVAKHQSHQRVHVEKIRFVWSRRFGVKCQAFTVSGILTNQVTIELEVMAENLRSGEQHVSHSIQAEGRYRGTVPVASWRVNRHCSQAVINSCWRLQVLTEIEKGRPSPRLRSAVVGLWCKVRPDGLNVRTVAISTSSRFSTVP